MSKTNWVVLLIGVVAALLFSAGTASAQTCTPLGFAGDCNLLITINPDGTTTSTNPSASTLNPNPYDGVEDQYVGVLNNDPSQIVNSIGLSGIGIFHFDSDGAFSGGNNCSGTGNPVTFPCGTGGGTSGGAGDNGYASAGVNFSGITLGDGVSTADTGTILFLNGGLSSSSGNNLGLFSLEEPASLTGVGVTGINVTPEPGTIILCLTGIGLGFLMRKRLAQGHQQAT
jgi:hypothetical protein